MRSSPAGGLRRQETDRPAGVRAHSATVCVGSRASTSSYPNERDLIAATCMLITAPNLLRSGRRHGSWRMSSPGCGHGRAVVRAALEHALASDCHHVLMQSGRADPRVHAFYEKLGFVPGLRAAYVAKRPADDGA